MPRWISPPIPRCAWRATRPRRPRPASSSRAASAIRCPRCAANFVGLASEIPILDSRRALEDRAVAEHGAVRERERALNAVVRSELQRQREALAVRREALARFEREVFQRQSAFLEMAESAYRLGRGTLFELLDARRTQLEAALAHAELAAAIAETQIELRALAGAL